MVTPVGSFTGFSGQIAVGLDAVEVPRFRAMLARRPGLRARLFSEDELAYAARFRDDAPRLAARFAAKEATLKALGVGLGGARFKELEVSREASGAPLLRVRGQAAELARERGLSAWAVSLTHTDLMALAVVVGRGG
ncbi:MAG: holo-ACP synthase [Acidimicrobiales bacterium]